MASGATTSRYGRRGELFWVLDTRMARPVWSGSPTVALPWLSGLTDFFEQASSEQRIRCEPNGLEGHSRPICYVEQTMLAVGEIEYP